MSQSDTDKKEVLQQEERVAVAQKRAANAQRRAAKAQAKAARTFLRSERARSLEDESGVMGGIFELTSGFMTPKRLAIAIGVVIVIIAVVGGSIAFFLANQNRTEYLSASSLTKVVNVNDLAAAEVSYEGIAEKSNPENNDEIQYRIRYKSTITASVDMSKISFDIDNESRVVKPKIPDIVVKNPTIDTNSFDYLPENPNADLKEVIALCKKDAKHDAGQNELLKNTAMRNLKTTIEALTKPLLDTYGYAIEWDDSESEGNNDDTNN